jgi:hypothetical protein
VFVSPGRPAFGDGSQGQIDRGNCRLEQLPDGGECFYGGEMPAVSGILRLEDQFQPGFGRRRRLGGEPVEVADLQPGRGDTLNEQPFQGRGGLAAQLVLQGPELVLEGFGQQQVRARRQ